MLCRFASLWFVLAYFSVDPLAAQERVRPGARGASAAESTEGPGTVWAHYEIDEFEPALQRVVTDLGRAATSLGDLDGDGVNDLAIASSRYVWILFMAADGSVKGHAAPIVTLHPQGGFLTPQSLACLGDLSGDGTIELAAGGLGIGLDGRVVIWSLGSAGEVRGQVDILASSLGVAHASTLGRGLSRIGDLDGNGVEDLAVADHRSRFWIFLLNADGTVASHEGIHSEDVGLGPLDHLGRAVAGLGDVDGDGVGDLAVLTRREGERLIVVLMNPDGSVKSFQHSPFAFSDSNYGVFFEDTLVGIDDLDGDGIPDLLAGRGWRWNAEELFVLFLNADGSLESQQQVAVGLAGFTGEVESGDGFGASLAYLGDLDSDGGIEVAVGAVYDDKGAAWVLSFGGDGTVLGHSKLEPGVSPPAGGIERTEPFGASLVSIGDLDGDGTDELAVASPNVFSGPSSVRVLFMRSDGSVEDVSVINVESIELGPDRFHRRVARNLLALGDVDGDGVQDLGVSGEISGPGTGGGLYVTWLLFLNRDGSVRDHVMLTGGRPERAAAIGDVDGDGVTEMAVPSANGRRVILQFLTPLGNSHSSREIHLGFAVRSLGRLGDFNGDGVPDLAVSGSTDAKGGFVQLLCLDRAGNVIETREIRGTTVGADPQLDPWFGWSIAAPGDLDANGTTDLAIGSFDPGHDGHSTPIWIVLLESDGSVASWSRIDPGIEVFAGEVEIDDTFGLSIASLGDLNGDGIPDLAVGAPGMGGHSPWPGVWILFLDGIGRLDFAGLANGHSLRQANPFESLASIDSEGANFGPAAFDSTPGGPNDPGRDPDLLVDRGNVLILQEDPTQTVAGVFDFPDDSVFGGTLSFEFVGPVELHSIDLVDICPDPTQDAMLTLTDSTGDQRVYLVPSGWTSDVGVEGTGVGTLDLTSLDAQPGFAATAIASETAGFDPRDVVRLEVALTSSGAVDALVYDPHPRTDPEEDPAGPRLLTPGANRRGLRRR